MITYEVFRELFYMIGDEPEFEVYFKNNSKMYMITKYKDYVTFQTSGSGEMKYKNLDELYHSELINGICLKTDWENIEDIILWPIFDFSSPSDIEKIRKMYKMYGSA
ncbi:MAG: hypothetical protein HFE58_08055 [Firmicutes bacterium]|nr:hypothetical protein [Bacillota bacterium]